MYQNFKNIKHHYQKKQNPHSLKIPYSFNKKYILTFNTNFTTLIKISKFKYQISLQHNKIKIKLKLFKTFFQPTYNKIIKHIKNLFKSLKFNNINKIFIINKFSKSYILQNTIQKTFPNYQIIIPQKPNLTILHKTIILNYNLQNITSHIT